MKKRVVMVFFFFVLAAMGLVSRILMISVQPSYVQAASVQGTYRVEICNTRGRIYDCRMRSLAGGRRQYRAVVIPSSETIIKLTRHLSAEKIVEIEEQLKGRYPFVCDVENADVNGDGAIVYAAQKRYGENNIAVHTVGYIDGSGKGVFGMERAYDEYLQSASGEMVARFTVDARGSGLEGIEPELTDTTENSAAGVVLTIDADIQQTAEEAAKLMDKGAVVIMEVKSGKIRASVSVPTFKQDNVAASLEAQDSPLVNRAISAYDLGSVFKPVVAAAALELGVTADRVYNCEGSVQIGDNVFHCSNHSGHGEITMEEAMAYSCNTYFIDLAQYIGAQVITEYARRFGIGQSLMLADNYFTAQGCVPQADELSGPAALANLSFGQGELLSTPTHMASVTAAIANGGVQVPPSVVEGLVDSSLEFVGTYYSGSPQRVISEDTARLLRGFMESAVVYGTAKNGGAQNVVCAAKTGTAETGMTQDGKKVLQAWYTGYFPADDPVYAVTVMVENGSSGGASAGPVFRYIAEQLG